MTQNDTYGEFTRADEVRFVRLVPGPIDRVWAYLTDPEKRGLWLAKGKTEQRVGGVIQFHFNHSDYAPNEKPPKSCGGAAEDGSCNFEGRVLQCDPPRLLSFTWPEDEGEGSEVSFELAERGKEVELVLTHRRVKNRNVCPGWHTHLNVLCARLAGEPLPPFWSKFSSLEPEYEKRFAALAK